MEKTLPIQLALDKGQSKSAHLQNVQAGSVITLAAKANCELWLDLKRKDDSTRVFASKMPLEWSTIISIAEAGEYLLYFHNRSDAACSFKGELNVSLTTAGAASIEQQLKRLSEQLQKVFIMDAIDYQLVDCDSSNSYARGSEVLLCRQHLETLRDNAPDTEAAQHLIFFTLMHETAHVLLTQWRYPFNNNEDVVDEFGVVLTRLMKRDAAIEAQARYFEQQPSQSEYEHILNNDDRHTLSIQRARNLRGWAADASLMARWMPFLIPHIRSDHLQALTTTPNKELGTLITAELAARKTKPAQ
ncbi:MAG: DUF4344 domain-containing metallopeptidase [Halioglobus sp.]